MNSSRHSLALVSFFAAMLAVFGMIPKIDLPFGVPITLQTLGVMLAGCLLGARRGFQSVLLFLAAVSIGLPLLSGGRGGLGVFAAPSAGYLLGWPLGALVTGWLMGRLRALAQCASGAWTRSLVGAALTEARVRRTASLATRGHGMDD